MRPRVGNNLAGRKVVSVSDSLGFLTASFRAGLFVAFVRAFGLALGFGNKLKMLKQSCLISASALLLLPAAAAAQTAGTLGDEITVTSLRVVDAASATSAVTIIDAEDLAVRNSPYVADQLRAVPGLAISRSGSVGGLTQLRLRGSEGNHTLVLLNGIEISNPVTGETDFGILSGLNASRIEVARGEQSGLYGSDAIGGVVAITTADEGLSASAEAGSFGTKRAQMGIAGAKNAAKFNLSLSGFDTDGVDTSGMGGGKDGASAYSLLTGGEIALPGNWTISGLASFRRSDVEFDSDTDFDGALNDNDLDSTVDQIILGASLRGQTGNIDHALRASFTDVSTVSNDSGNFSNETIGTRKKVSYSPSVSFASGGADMVVSGLVDLENEDYERIDTDTLFGDSNQAQSFDTLGFAGEARAVIGAAALSGSMRFDDNDGRFDNATTWRIGGAYNFDFGGKLRVSAGTGVKNPTFTELFGFFPGSFIGNPDLNPETSKSWEIGYDHNFGSVQTSLTYFQADLEDEITTVFDASFNSTPANLAGDSERSGIEFAADWAVSDGLNISASLSDIQTEDGSGTDEIRQPGTTGSVSLSWASQVKDGMTGGVSADYVGEQDDFNFGTFPSTRVTLDSYVLVSANFAYPINDDFALTLRGENLLDETVQDVFSYNNTGAGVFVGFKLR